MAVSIGEAVLSIGFDDAQLKKGMKGIGATLKKHSRAIGLGMTAVGGTILAIGVTSVKAFADMGDEIHKMSLRTGIATESLSRLKFAAELGGASLQTIEKAIKRMASSLQDARDGLATSVDAMDALGLSVEDFDGLNPEEAFMKMAGAVAAIEDPLIRSALAQDVFGRAGTEILPMLAEGTEGLKAMMAEAEKFAVIMDEDAAEAAAVLTDQMTKLKGGFQKVQAEIAMKLIPILIPLIDKIVLAVSSVSAWMKANPGLTKTIIIIASVIGGLMLVLGPLLLILPGIIAALPILGAAFAILTGPVGLIIAAIVGLIAIGVLLWKNWATIKEKAITIFTSVKDFFAGIWGTISDIFTNNINSIIGQINKLIGLINLIPGVDIGKIGKIGGGDLEGFAHGGIITNPTLLTRVGSSTPFGIMAERGPERISPIGNGQMMTIIYEVDGRQLARTVMPYAVGEIRVKQGLRV